MKIRIFNRAFLLSAALLTLTGCKEKTAPAAGGPTPVTLTLDWKPEPEFGGFYAAQETGAWARHGLKVDIHSGGSGSPMWQLVASRQADFATTAADQLLIGRNNGADVIALFAVYQTFPQGVMVHQSRGLKSLSEAFTSPGTLAAENDPWLKFCLAQFQPVKVSVIAFSGGVAGFLSKPDFSQQCFVTSEPFLARRQGGDPQTFRIVDYGYNPYTTVLITRSELVRSDPARVRAMVDACREGWRSYLDAPGPINAVMGKLNPEMDAQSFSEAAAAQKPLIETDETKTNGLGSMTKQRWNDLAQQLISLKVIASAPPADECFVDWAKK